MKPSVRKMESKLESLNRDMKRFFDIHVENRESLSKKTNVYRGLHKDITQILQNRNTSLTRIVPFGSYQSGTSKSGSDIDIVICMEKLAENIYNPDEKKMKNIILHRLHQLLPTLPAQRNYEKLTHIEAAVVPILRGCLDGVGFDLSIHFGPSVPLVVTAAKFIKTVVRFHPEFTILLNFIKGWLRGSVSRSTIPNSYALSLLVVHFLQNYEVIPNLHQMYPQKFDPKNVTWSTSNSSVSEREILLWNKKRSRGSMEQKLPSKLFVDFLTHYSKYPIEMYFVNMAEGVLDRKKTRSGLKIKDPYDPQNPGRSVSNPDDFQRLINNTLQNIKNSESRRLIDDIWKSRDW